MRGTYDTTTTHTAKRPLAPLLTRPGHMESGGEAARWRFGAANPALQAAGRQSIRSIISALYDSLDTTDPRPVAPLGHGDPSAFACFRTAPAAVDAIAAAALSGKHNCYSRAAGVEEARRY
jgi:tyrosine aminotransferase